MKEEDRLPNEEIELTFDLMNKDVQEFDEDFKTTLEAHNNATPELRKTVESMFLDIKKKVENIQTFDFKAKIEDTKRVAKEWSDKKRLKEIEKVNLEKEMTKLREMIAKSTDEFEAIEKELSSAETTLDTLLTNHLEIVHEIEAGMDSLFLSKEELDNIGCESGELVCHN